MSIVDLASATNGHDVCDSVWTRCVLGVLDPSHHLGLGRLQQCDGVEEEVAVGFAHNGDCFCDFIACKGIEGVVRDHAARQM